MILVNHKQNKQKNFPSFTHEELTEKMLKEIAESKPNFAFVLEWPADGSMPICHTSTEDAPVLAYRLQQFLGYLYRKQPLNLTK